jgi:hypothetical protein
MSSRNSVFRWLPGSAARISSSAWWAGISRCCAEYTAATAGVRLRPSKQCRNTVRPSARSPAIVSAASSSTKRRCGFAPGWSTSQNSTLARSVSCRPTRHSETTASTSGGRRRNAASEPIHTPGSCGCCTSVFAPEGGNRSISGHPVLSAPRTASIARSTRSRTCIPGQP